MSTYIGYSSIGANQPKSTNVLNGIDNGPGTLGRPIYTGKKTTLLDAQLVMQDFINALNISKGQKVGQPGYGTIIWSFIFEPNTPDTQSKILSEMRRVASADPRMDINTIKAYPQEAGILIELQMSMLPFNNPQILNLFFNQSTNTASLLN